jgi:hypothetical protein
MKCESENLTSLSLVTNTFAKSFSVSSVVKHAFKLLELNLQDTKVEKDKHFLKLFSAFLLPPVR